MKKIFFYCLISSFFMISCEKDKSNIPIFSYSLLNNNVKNYHLNIKRKGNLVKYEYLHKNDETKRLLLNYNDELDILITKFDTFYPINNTYKSKTLLFKMYQRKIIKSHNRSLVFNKKYGLLANLALGADFMFLKDSISNNDKEMLFKELFLKLNEIDNQ